MDPVTEAYAAHVMRYETELLVSVPEWQDAPTDNTQRLDRLLELMAELTDLDCLSWRDQL